MSNVALFSGSNVPAFAKKASVSSLAKSLAGGAGARGHAAPAWRVVQHPFRSLDDPPAGRQLCGAGLSPAPPD